MINQYTCVTTEISKRLYCKFGTFQRWSRGHNVRGQAKAMAKDSKHIRDQGLTLRGQILPRPRTGMVEAKAKN